MECCNNIEIYQQTYQESYQISVDNKIENNLQKIIEKKIINKENSDISFHKYNLYQQFFVIGIDKKIMYNINELDLKNIPEPLNIPKVISKYPNTDLPYLTIPDAIIASHCFPQGIINALIDYEEKDLEKKIKKQESFIFNLENMCPEIKMSSLRINKVYYTCLLFYENVENYRNCINQIKSNKTSEIRNKGLLIPKVICLSTFSPYYDQTKSILQKLKLYVDNYNYNNKSAENPNIYPIEKIIEGLIFTLPALPRGNCSIRLNINSFNFDSKINENNNNNKKYDENNDNENYDENLKYIIFKETPPNKTIRIIMNYSILMYYFRIEEIFEVIKYIILEEPILFVCENKEILSNIIESFISLLYPLQYPHPVITILPEQNYSFISLFKHFIFGINVKYSEEYLTKKIILDGVKFIRIIRLEKRFYNIINTHEIDTLGYSIFSSLKADENKPLIKIDESNENGYINDIKDSETINKKKTINLPRHYFEKCVRRLEKNVNDKIKDLLNKNKNQINNNIEKEKENIFNNEIRQKMLYFFSCILLKYQEYCVKYDRKIYEDKNKDGNIIEKEFGERNNKLEEKYYLGNITLEDIFDCEEFIDSIPSLDRDFYNIFFKTKIFFNFIYKKIFPDSNQDKLEILFFDETINKKISRESRMKNIETKFLSYDYEVLINQIYINSLKRTINSNLNSFLLKNKNRDKALNYFQYIYSDYDEDDNSEDEEALKDKNKQIYFYYYVFPILLNDGIFYNEKNNNNKKWVDSEYFQDCLISRRLYDDFEEDSALIVEDKEMNKNYKLYNYSLNPTSQFHLKNEYMIKMLWLRYFSKILHCIPFSKKKIYFEIINDFLKNNKNIIDERTILILFNSIYKYGDRSMNQDFFINLKNKSYTSYLCLREKTKPENNFIKYMIYQENKYINTSRNNSISNDTTPKFPNYRKFILEESKFMTFTAKCFCMGKKEELNLYQNEDSNANTDSEDNNICNEPLTEKISELYSDSEEYIQFKCNKCYKDQKLLISCQYVDEENNTFIIDFELLSPMALLKQKWFQDYSELEPSFICEEYLEYYLSAIFYFYDQNLPCEFLMPDFKKKKKIEFKETRNISYSNIHSKEFYDKNDIDKIIIIENKKNDENNTNKNITIDDNFNSEKNLKSCFKSRKKIAKNVEFKLENDKEKEKEKEKETEKEREKEKEN